jgi:predicted AAA+ superfamily ATPase
MVKYYKRYIEKTINDYLKIFGAVNIEGIKGCGKTTTSKNMVKSTIHTIDLTETDLKTSGFLKIVEGKEKPILIDE